MYFVYNGPKSSLKTSSYVGRTLQKTCSRDRKNGCRNVLVYELSPRFCKWCRQQALLEDGSIDHETTKQLVQAATAAAAETEATGSCSVTFHRAFDCCTTEPLAALEILVR